MSWSKLFDEFYQEILDYTPEFQQLSFLRNNVFSGAFFLSIHIVNYQSGFFQELSTFWNCFSFKNWVISGTEFFNGLIFYKNLVLPRTEFFGKTIFTQSLKKPIGSFSQQCSNTTFCATVLEFSCIYYYSHAIQHSYCTPTVHYRIIQQYSSIILTSNYINTTEILYNSTTVLK